MNRRWFLISTLLAACSDEMITRRKILGNQHTSNAGTVTYYNLISGFSQDPLNRFIYVSFDPDGYHFSGGAIQASDLALVFTKNAGSGGTATGCSITSVTKIDGTALAGGEGVIKVNITVTGSCSGVETITIGPSLQGTIKDSANRPISFFSSTGTIQLTITYNATYAAVLLSALTRATPINIPSAEQRLLDNTLAISLVSYIASFDGLFVIADDRSDHSFAKINWINPGTSTDAVENGSLVWGSGSGTVSDGSSYMDFSYNPITNGSNYTQNNASFWIYSNDDLNLNAAMAGAAGNSAANTGRVLIKVRTAGLAAYCINRNSGSGTTVANANGKGLFVVSRSNNSDEKFYKDGVLIGSNAALSSTMTNKNFYGNASNENGTAGSLNNIHNLGLVAWGSNMQSNIPAITTIFNTWLAATTAPSPPADSGRLYVCSGQSGMRNPNSYTELPAYLQAVIPNCYFLSKQSNLWVPLQAGVTTLSGASPIFALAYNEQIKYPGEKLYFVEYSVGGSPISLWESGQIYYNTIVSYINTALSILSVTHFMPYYWYQGEEDAKLLSTANAYGGPTGAELALMTSMFAAIGTNRAVVIRINDNLPSGFPYATTVNAWKDSDYAAGYFGISGGVGGLVQTTDLPYNTDNIHLTAAGAVTCGQRMSAAST